MSRKKTHEEYVVEIANINPNFEVIDKYNGAHTKINHKCKMCNNIVSKEPISVLQGSGCPVCKGRIAGKAPDYKNSIWSSEYKEYFSNYMNEEQMKTTLPFSNLKMEVFCPTCGRAKKIAPCDLITGLSCVCEDGKSYPNKFIYQLLNQLKIEYIPEYSPDWAKNKFYDIYIPDFNIIIENHGMQHYREGAFGCNLNEVEQNDLYKEVLAIENGIQYYCILDCRWSKADWIKESVINSMLPNLLGFKEYDIDWLSCDEYASSNLIYSAAQLFNEGLNTTQVANKLSINRKTARRYLKKATDFGLCNYNAKEEHSKAARKSKNVNVFPVYCLEKNAVCNTLKEMSELCSGLDKRNIHACIKQKYKTCGGMHFYYLYDHILNDGKVIKGAITLGFIKEDDALKQLNNMAFA